MRSQSKSKANEAGFSLAELIVAMAVTLILLVVASTLLAAAFNARRRENQRTDALADAQRALNIMSREIANAGFSLTTNGVVASDSGPDANGEGTIRVRANLNHYDTSASITARNGISVVGEDAGEDVKYFLNPAADTTYLVRYDMYGTPQKTVLANRIDALRLFFYGDRVTYTTGNCNNLPNPTVISNVLTPAGAAAAQVTPDQASYVVIAACVRLDAVGRPGSAGYQPPSSVLLVSDVALRQSYMVRF